MGARPYRRQAPARPLYWPSSSGIAGFTSPVAKKAGTFIFTVTGVTLQGWTYKPDLNTETTDSITR